MEKVKLTSFEYKTPSVFIALIILTVMFVLIIVGVQSDPARSPAEQQVQSPTGTGE